ncbi:hypothetical protein CYMTET_56872 [Cymbomonas tetramitiformis]|uniref:F-box domain-containing protein n=1 Tax=Cymbomonas tetramitiformis TaxID=36881 RepID=A0AAE0ELV6_9CHLO|nr:hypothetical protein CYMTET_56872 [Cymbomonas tetramitiformis]
MGQRSGVLKEITGQSATTSTTLMERDDSLDAQVKSGERSAGYPVAKMARLDSARVVSGTDVPDWREVHGLLPRIFDILLHLEGGNKNVYQASRVCRSWRAIAVDILLGDTAASRPIRRQQQPPTRASAPAGSEHTTLAAITRNTGPDNELEACSLLRPLSVPETSGGPVESERPRGPSQSERPRGSCDSERSRRPPPARRRTTSSRPKSCRSDQGVMPRADSTEAAVTAAVDADSIEQNQDSEVVTKQREVDDQ